MRLAALVLALLAACSPPRPESGDYDTVLLNVGTGITSLQFHDDGTITGSFDFSGGFEVYTGSVSQGYYAGREFSMVLEVAGYGPLHVSRGTWDGQDTLDGLAVGDGLAGTRWHARLIRNGPRGKQPGPQNPGDDGP